MSNKGNGQSYQCPACHKYFEGAVCECGYIHLIMPGKVPSSIKEMVDKQVRVIQKRIGEKEAIQKQSTEITGERVALISEKNKELEEQKKVLEQQLEVEKGKALENEKKLYDSFQENDRLIKQISMLESAAKVVEAQRKDLSEKLKNANDNLTKEINEHIRTKLKLEQYKTDTTSYVMSEQPQVQSHSCPGARHQQGQAVAKIILTCGTQMIQNDVFSGNNNYEIPVSMNSSVRGDAFRIEALNGKVFRLYDLCGLTCKINGDKIQTTGTQLYDNDYFYVGNITIQIKLPKMNLRDLLK